MATVVSCKKGLIAKKLAREHILTLWTQRPLKFWFLKIQYGGWPPL